MIDGVVVKPLKPIPDERGELCEMLRSDDPLFERFGQIYYTTTRPGIVKAWHCHRAQTDHMVSLGAPALIVLCDARADSPTKGEVMEIIAGRSNPTLVKIPPGIYHGFTPAEGEEILVVNMPTKLYNYDDPDEQRLDPFDNDLDFDWRARGATEGR